MLGGLSVESDGAPASGAAAQRSRLALLALLAGSGDRGLSRDKVMALLWPEADTDKARHALRLALSALRRDLHQDNLFLETPALRLNPEVIVTDVAELEAAATSGEHQRVIALYAGSFLDGFFLTAAPEFEWWVETERARLAEVIKRSLECLAHESATRGNHRAAVDYWRKLAVLDPMSARVTIQLMRSLADSGDSAGALNAARVHEALMREEFGAAPDPGVLTLAAALREQPPATVESHPPVRTPSNGPALETGTGDAWRPQQVAFRRRRALSAAAALVLVTTGVAVGGWQMRGQRLDAPTGVTSTIAVLPFSDLSAGTDDTFIGDGIAEELTNVLTRLEQLRVVSQTSVRALDGTKQDVRQIGRKLNVTNVLEGSIRRTGDRLRITARLIDARTGFDRWSNAYDVEAKDILAVQQGISRAIVSSLQLHLSDAALRSLAHHNANDPEVYVLYLKGRYYWNKRTPAAVETAIAHFQNAIRRDSLYARAYVGLADAFRSAAMFGDRARLTEARAAAERAFALDSSLGEAIASVGELKANDWQWSRAEGDFRRAIALNPGYAPVHAWYGSLLAGLGRSEQAVKELRVAHELDPLSLTIENALATQLFRVGKNDEAFQRWASILDIDPDFLPARRRRALANIALGRTDSALAELEAMLTTPGATTREDALLAYGYAVAGQGTEARRILRSLDSPNRQYVSPYHMALVYAALGEDQRALDLLERAGDERDPFVTNLVADQWMFPSLITDPRYTRLRARVGL